MDKELNKETKKYLLLADIHKDIAKCLNVDELKRQVKNYCKIYFPNANKFLVNSICEYACCLSNAFQWRLDLDFFVRKYENKSTKKGAKK